MRYVLEGSVQRDQNRVRVNAQLIDGETGAHLWADRFEESITDLFKLQDQVVARLANTLGYELVKAEAQRGTHSTNLDAIDLTMRGWAAHWQPPTEESMTSARDYFERAIKLDPQNAEAMAGLAYARLRASYYGWSTAAEDKPLAQLELLTKATAINPGYALAYYVKSTALWVAKEYPDSLAAAETEVALDPNSAYGYSAMGRAEALLGRCEQTIAHTKQAFALSPRDPFSGIWYIFLSDTRRIVQKDLDIAEYADPAHNPMIPHVIVLEPGLVVYKIYEWLPVPSASPLWKISARTYVGLPRNVGRIGTSQRPNSGRRGSKAARNSSIPTAKPTPKLSENRTSSVCVNSGRHGVENFDPHASRCLRTGHRSGRYWLCRELVVSRRQSHLALDWMTEFLARCAGLGRTGEGDTNSYACCARRGRI